MAKGNISRKMKKINGGSLSGDGNILLEKGWRKIGEYELTAEDEKAMLVFSPTVGTNANTAYVETPAFRCEKLRIYIESPMQSELSGSTYTAYVEAASDAEGKVFDLSPGAKRFFGWTILSKTYDVYSAIDIVTSPYMPTHAEGFNNGKLGASDVSTTQISWSGEKQQLSQVTGVRLSFGTTLNFYAGMKFVLLGVDK